MAAFLSTSSHHGHILTSSYADTLEGSLPLTLMWLKYTVFLGGLGPLNIVTARLRIRNAAF